MGSLGYDKFVPCDLTTVWSSVVYLLKRYTVILSIMSIIADDLEIKLFPRDR